jgi:hypothetical protein
MELADRIKSFDLLGDRLRRFHENSQDPDILPLVEAARSASMQNPWFTPEHIRIALNNLGQALTHENLVNWLSPYLERITGLSVQKRIGVVMAGNIPAVGFHDFLCVLISGHKLLAKLSSSDDKLLPAMSDILTDQCPEWHDHISFTNGKLENFDAIISTGSTNTSRYFEFYFGRYPHIIRKNRNSVAVLSGCETGLELQNLADDIMLFFGMGCRSVSKIFIPTGYDFSPLVHALGKYDYFANHHKYRNNYDYYKSIFLVNQVKCLDSGFLLLREDRSVTSPIAVLHYEYYPNPDEAVSRIREYGESIQCVISNMALPINSLPAGEGQKPPLWDYSDRVDTMDFLLS